MIGQTDHADILVALIGVVVATLPLMVTLILTVRHEAQRTRRVVNEGQAIAQTAVEEIRPHLPPNGARLYEMVQATAETVQGMQLSVAKLELALGEVHGEMLQSQELNAETRAMLLEHLERTAPAMEFVERLMGGEEA